MAIKPVKFEQYMQWYDNHDVVMKGKTESGTKAETTKAAATAPLQMAKLPAPDMELKPGTRIHMVQRKTNNHIVLGADGHYEPPLKHSVDDQRVAIIESSRSTIGPTVSLEREDEFDTEWEKVGDEGEGEWVLL
ncbi:hypothetical protein Q9L58_001932 [Maublancomyces gigas]|uniref:Uncharacterized protein n=1 Tax=Discina gigas TaxID=1032678 RepID=A0ABR3GSY0_9PEZI